MQLSDLVKVLGGELLGDNVDIVRAAALENAFAGSVAFVASRKFLAAAQASKAAALIVPPDLVEHLVYLTAKPRAVALVVTANPQLYFAKLLNVLHPAKKPMPGIHPSAVVHESATVHESAEIAELVSIGAGSVIGAGSRIGAGSVVGEHCTIGEHCTLHARVTLYDNCTVGDRVILHANSVIGADGFGNAWDAETSSWVKIPQIGGVTIESDCEIGAGSTIDRGALENTFIGQGSRIDNLVQIAHNVKIGAGCAIAACVGIAGSVVIGKQCIIGGAAMLVGHITIVDNTVIGGGTLVSHSIKERGHYASSYPLQSHRDWTRNAVHVRKLSAMNQRIKQLEHALSNLTSAQQE